MSDPPKIKEFPTLKSKLAAPTKKSLFERQKAEAEAKRQRDEAETAAVYEDFVKSFEDEEPPPNSGLAGGNLGGSGFSGSSAGGRRHFTGPPTGPALSRGGPGGIGGRGGPPLSGPGSLGPVGPPSRKRNFDGSQRNYGANDQGVLNFDNSISGPVDAATAFREDEEEATQEAKDLERAPPKPTLHLSSLPPGTSTAVIKSLFPSSLRIDSVRVLPPVGPSTMDRKSMSAIVTLATDTPGNEIDSTVNTLQNRYLGWGYNLNLSRHLSSAALNIGAINAPGLGGLQSMPFGARAPPTTATMNRAPPPNSIHRGGFAPPSSYNSPASRFGPGGMLQVAVKPPSDLKELKLIHKTIEAVLSHGPEFEAVLMNRPDIQRDQKWAWLFDSRSDGGVWYRWRLWNVLSGSSDGSGYGRSISKGIPQYVFEGQPPWITPKKGLRFEYVTELEEFVTDDDYQSSDEEEEEERYRQQQGAPPDRALDTIRGGTDVDGKGYLNPLQKSKLIHLLARLPTSTGKLRRGDIARVTAFAIEHASEGAEEVVEMVIANVEHPFAYQSANPESKDDLDDEEMKEPPVDGAQLGTGEREKTIKDVSSAKLIGLYAISDILSSSSTSGVRHAWRYRQLFETALADRKIFEGLGRLDREMKWGRLRAEKWKRSVGSLLSLWEGWCVFPQASQERFVSVFNNPPPTAAEESALAKGTSEATTTPAKSRWKTVDTTAPQVPESSPAANPYVYEEPAASADADDVDGEPMIDEDLDGEPMDEDLDGEPMDEDIDGEPLVEDEPEPEPSDRNRNGDVAVDAEVEVPKAAGFSMGLGAQKAPERKKRPTAEDMFAESDDDD